MNMNRVVQLPRPYEVKWAKSKKLLSAHIEYYNQDKPLGDQLRSAHRKLMEYLLYLYSLTLKKKQAIEGPLLPGGALPALYTNNEQLAQEMGCSVRTIQNLRRRLIEADFITGEVWHGSNSSYEVYLSFNTVHLEWRGDPCNVVRNFAPFVSENRADEAASAAPAAAPPTKSLRHTVSRNRTQVTKELIELSGVDDPQTLGFQLETNFSNVESRGKRPKCVENTADNPQLVSNQDTQDTFSGYETGRTQAGDSPPSCAAPPQEDGEQRAGRPDPKAKNPKPDSLVEVVEGLPDQQVRSIGRHVDVIYNAAIAELYPDKWICDQEKARTRARIAEYFIYAKPERYGAGAAEIMDRIMLVRKWIERGAWQDKKRWVPLPSIYFDYRNEKNGFTKTKPWYKAHKQAKREFKDNELLTKAMKEYLKSQEDGAAVSPAETYRRIAQRLGKRSKKLLERFHEQINLNEAA